VPSKENIVALVVESDDLSAFEFGLRRPKSLEEMGCEEAKRCAEVV
jgi:hypothetical protein